jgi:hypothetical protein
MSDFHDRTPHHVNPERARGRRTEDATTYSIGRGMLWVMRHWKLVATVVVSAVMGAASVSAWLGAQSSSPGQRTTRLETKVDLGLSAVNLRVDTLLERLARADSLRAQRDHDSDERMDLLLRLGCRQMKESDLQRQCDRQGVRR